MTTSDFDNHKVAHLFLLVGENPLPNYVTANLLLEKNGTLYLVHTTGTETQAKRLKNILDRDEEGKGFQPTQLISLGKYESDAYHIQDEICRKIKGLKNGKTGLNYTGGTKAMAVHSYRAVLSQFRPDTVFSYLDSRSLEMCIDREDRERIHIKVTPDVLKVDLKKIFELHGWKWGSDPIDEPKLIKAANAFAEFHTKEDSVTAWRNWCDQILRPVTKDKKYRWLKEEELKKINPLSLETVNSQPQIKSALIELGLTEEELSLEVVKKQGLKKLKHVCEWLDGEWLEHYVLQQVKEISKKWLIHDSATSFWIFTENNPKENKFQFDVAFMRGYQLFAISCTTDKSKQVCKSKLFEAYIRAQQLGGSEARVALVCCASQKDVNALQTEISNVFSSDSNAIIKDYKIAVFGADVLMNLSEEIDTWIYKNDEDAK
ncbi:DUF1887 family protein [Fortiea sp. LEGE XX443]|uniref:Card1-like endonuclease domain-containing protein n=1 Tax=Fortiea sp. LEGE XX443 TaxID=1828611 RepID=UPI0018805D4E|nr:DUF1887 family CARF protein [Fortiea sp. LEGE XX443]MBE9008450.1 DUF1887 family protein [Fortiea sp. LEGE XX443]